MRAIRVTQLVGEGTNDVELVDVESAAPADGEIAILVEYSSLNYKDALALTGRAGIIRAPQLIAGIDVVGVVHESRDARWTPGDRVIVTGRLVQRSYDTREGEKRTVVELQVDEVAPSLRYATAKITRAQRSSNGPQTTTGGNNPSITTGRPTNDDVWSDQSTGGFPDESPF